VNEYRYEIERLTRELQDLKKKYYEQKRKEQLAREVAQEGSKAGGASGTGRQQFEQQLLNARAATTRFTGGGFAIK
jgi:hypothetical protein